MAEEETVSSEKFNKLMQKYSEIKQELEKAKLEANELEELRAKNEKAEQKIHAMEIDSANKDLAYKVNARSAKSLFAELSPVEEDNIEQYIKEREKQIAKFKEDENHKWLFREEESEKVSVNGAIPAEPIRAETNELAFNPFSKNTLDFDECTRLYRTDPERAKKLASEAGVTI
jgi:hypothetical protein